MANEGLNHALSTLGCNDSLATVIVDTELFESESNCFSDLEDVVFQQLLQHWEGVSKEFASSPLKGKAWKKNGRLLPDFPAWVFKEIGSNLKQVVVNHFIHDLWLVHQLIEGLQCISAPSMIQVWLNEHLSELRNHPVKDGNSDLLGLNVRRERLLQIGVAFL